MKWLIKKLFGKKERETIKFDESIYRKAEKMFGDGEE